MKNFIKLHEVYLKKSKEVPDDENIGKYSDILVDVYKNGQTTQIEFKDLNNEKKIV